jgi:RHS repeat-associated protein
VTNLRLPGQYDERLFSAAGISGLAGPYYNWNRWYLPSVGRYLELDPIAKAGGFNGFYGPNWYGYAEGNPGRWSDPDGRGIRVLFDFWRNYVDMRDANTVHADKYFHCKANCEASSHGDFLEIFDKIDAWVLSELRELTDEYYKGDPPNACNADRDANRHGRLVPKNTSCRDWCSPFRPPALDPKY